MMATRGLSSVLCFVLAFALALAVPRPIVGPMRESLAAFSEGNYNVAFTGSSWTQMNVDPIAFDQACAERGVAIESFNLGLNGAGQGEITFLIDRLCEQERRPDFLLIDVSPWTPERNAYLEARTLRERNWHTLTNTVRALRLSLKAPENHRARYIKQHLRAWADRTFRLGAALEQTEFSVPERGFRAENDKLISEERYQALLKAALASETGPDRPWEVFHESAMKKHLETLKQAGVTPVLVVPPILEKRHAGESAIAFAKRHSIALLDFSDIERHPGLFDYANRIDGQHMNVAGAVLYSRALARGFVSQLGLAN